MQDKTQRSGTRW